MPNKKPARPVVSILRSARDEYLSPLVNPEEYPATDAFLTSRVASANDCTGIAVTVPTDEETAADVADLSANTGRAPVTPPDAPTK
ncbi:MAG: hypothetical protein IJ493_11805 [Clostridia bacterium]|nr:hypothetical protein [Clostridia bacterium]